MFNKSKFKTNEEVEERINNLKRVKSIYYERFVSAYRERVEKFYKEDLDECQRVFRLQNKVQLHLYLTNSEIYEVLIESEQDDFKCIVHLNLVKYEEWIKYEDVPESLKEERIKSEIEKSYRKVLNIEKSTYDRIEYKEVNQKYLEALAIENGKREADNCNLGLELDRYIQGLKKDVKGFKLYPAEEAIAKVNLEQFTNEFTECILCYESELYLASALVGVVCIETLLKVLIIRKLGKEKLPEQSYMLKTAQILVDNEIFTQKFFKRIQAINSLRHAIAHTATGSINQWDTEQILTAIKLLVEEYF